MPISPARAARMVRRSALCFDWVQDPRKARGKRHPLAGLLNVAVSALACLKLTFRGMEDFASDLDRRTLRRLGLGRATSDTTLYELVARLNESELRSVLWAQLRRDLDAKAIANDLFAKGVLSVDGKAAGSGMGLAPSKLLRQSACDGSLTACWYAYALRACLTSSSVRPVLDQEFIQTKGSESPAFRVVFTRLVGQFPKLFRYVTADANMAGVENARLVRSHGKHYVFALKGNRSSAFEAGLRALDGATPVALATEWVGGTAIQRELYRVSASEIPWADAREIWKVRQVCTDKTGNTTVEERMFVSSIPPEELSAEEALGLVRLHWGIENGPNWTADVVFKEDLQTPCTIGDGVAVMSWLRSLAYNLLSIFRARLPLKDRRPQSWTRAAELMRDVLVHFANVEPDATLA